jgi:hypothetical protein
VKTVISWASSFGLLACGGASSYVGEVSWTGWPQIFPDTPRPEHIRCLQKFEKVD